MTRSRTRARSRRPDVRVGISGWNYPPWRSVFYPKGLAHRRELEYASRQFNSIEINGTFYSLQRLDSFRRWYEQTPADFRFAIKGSRFITHMKKLREIETPLANFFASGPLALNEKLGPILWQFGPNWALDLERFEAFLEMLPRTTMEAARLACRHDDRLEGRAWTRIDAERPIRHAVEPRRHVFGVREVTSGVGEHERHVMTPQQAHVYVYFDNDAKVRAPFDAVRLARKLGLMPGCDADPRHEKDGNQKASSDSKLTPNETETRRSEIGWRWARRSPAD